MEIRAMQIRIVPFDTTYFHGVKFINEENVEVSLSFEKSSPHFDLCLFNNISGKDITAIFFDGKEAVPYFTIEEFEKTISIIKQ